MSLPLIPRPAYTQCLPSPFIDRDIITSPEGAAIRHLNLADVLLMPS